MTDRDIPDEPTREEWDILDHTINRASVRGMFCGDSPDMQRLVRRGWMALAGRVSWVPSPYFRATALGIRKWREWHAEMEKKKPKPPKLSAAKERSKRRYHEFLQADPGCSFFEWLKMNYGRTRYRSVCKP